MWTFQYKHGDRPLDGFTIQRAAGRGGFGEVYYAVSDSGREVALKAVTGYEQIEVRGISQCMNLKSPHLVTIFDVKYNDMGKPFVIMEFVGGPNLRQLMDESPAGLGTQKAAFFLREIGKGLTFLHDCGIVHRDLKPANIFFENGYVKIGDYGLSKAISPTQHSGQTVTVGTVHYMAPEVGAGKYDRSIDIYAMGAVLYEMLTGTVPFIGASPSEILIKHLQAEPDCGGIPEPFCTVIKKAMAKDPAQRYASVQEMVEGVFGAEHVRMSVSHFSPDDLSVVAGRVAQKVGIGPGSRGIGGGIGSAGLGGGGSSSVVGGNNIGADIRNRFEETGQRLRDNVERIHNRFSELRVDPNANPGSSANARDTSSDELGINDPLPKGSRRALGLLAAVVVAIAMGALADSSSIGSLTPITVPLFVFTAICGGSFGLLFGWRRIAIPKLSKESHGVRKLVVALITCGTMLLFSGYFWLVMVNHGPFHNGTLLAILAPLSLFNTWEWARANREERVSLTPALWIGFVGFILTSVFNGESMLAAAVLAGISLAVQVMAPWDPMLANDRKFRVKSKMSGAKTDPREAVVYPNVPTGNPFEAAFDPIYGNANIGSPNNFAPPSKPQKITYPVWPFAPAMWLAWTILLFSCGLTAAILAGNSRGSDSDMLAAMGACGIVNAIICFIFIFKRRYASIWSYIVRPLLLMACIDSIVIFGVIAADQDVNGGCIFAIVFSSVILVALPFLRFDRHFGAAAPVIPPVIPPMSPPPIPPFDAARFTPPVPPQPIRNDAPIPPAPPIDPSRWPKTSRQWRQWNRVYRMNRVHRQRAKKGFSALLAWMLILLSVALMLAIGLNLPLAVSLGLPDAKMAREIRTNFLGDFPNWLTLANKLLVASELLIVVMAIVTTLIVRIGTNFLHLFRSVVGILGLLVAAAFASGKFHADEVWLTVHQQLLQGDKGGAIDTIISHFQNPATIAAAIIFVISMLILSIPPRKRTNPTKGVA